MMLTAVILGDINLESVNGGEEVTYKNPRENMSPMPSFLATFMLSLYTWNNGIPKIQISSKILIAA